MSCPGDDGWTVTRFNEVSLYGVVSRRNGGDPQWSWFHSTSFQSDSSQRWPRVGERVEVVFAGSGAVLSVHGR